MKLFIFGSTGDLVKRMVIPAFIGLNLANLEIIALGRRDFTNTEYENFVSGNNGFKTLMNKPKYLKVEFDNQVRCMGCEEFLDKTKINFFYIAMPPKEIKKILIFIGKLKEKGFKLSILIEKPFGENLKSAKSLKRLLFQIGLLNDVFISDHYLFKKEVINLKSTSDFKKIKIASLEKVGLENRCYYNDIGALKDMVQSHLLNMAFKFIKNPKKEFADFEILEYLRGQYGNGKNTGYIKELGSSSDTETLAKVRLRKKGREFEFISGKKFDKKLGFIEIDGKRIYLKSLKNPYSDLFLDFFSQNRKKFTTIDNSILAWKIIERIELKKPELIYYPENTSFKTFI